MAHVSWRGATEIVTATDAKEEANAFKIKFPEQAYLVREFIGSDELINNYKRYCLWLKDAQPSDIKNNSEIKQRVENVKSFRHISFAGKYNAYFLLLYEQYDWIQNAIAREKEIKGWRREKKEALINSINPD